MVDPTSDLGEGVDEESAPRCAVCGDPALGAGRRTATRVTDGAVTHTHFCGEACLEEWREPGDDSE